MFASFAAVLLVWVLIVIDSEAELKFFLGVAANCLDLLLLLLFFSSSSSPSSSSSSSSLAELRPFPHFS